MSPPGVSFADALSSFDEAEFVLLGVPFDRTASFRPGARFAPNAIREASYNFETFLFEHDISILNIPVHDAGNTEEFGGAEEMVRSVAAEVERIVSAGKFPIVMGGEHSVSIPAVRSFRDIAVISVDAHLDFRNQYLGSGLSHACTTRRISEHVGLDNIIVIGVRSISSDETEGQLPFVLDAFTIDEKGIDWVCKRVMERIDGKMVYLTLDIDGIDPAYAPGTGTPEPFGLTPLQVKKLIGVIGQGMVGFDVVEVSPPYDNGNTAALAARLIREVMAVCWKDR